MLESSKKANTVLQKHLFQHFDLAGYTNFLEDVSLALIDKTDPRDPAEREG